jgi:hypothetical protein
MLPFMRIEEISPEAVDSDDESFRISEDLDSGFLLESLREFGQLNPLVLLEQGPRRLLVCGFRRLRAIRELGMPRALARILPEQAFSPSRAFELALRDNLSHRELDPLEKARALFNLQNRIHVPDGVLINSYLPLLGLHPRDSVLRSYLTLHEAHPALRKSMVEGRLTHASVEAISEMPRPAQVRIALLMEKMRLSASLQRKFLGLLEDLGAGSGCRPEALLGNPEIEAITGDSRLSPFEKGEKVYELMYRLRNPRLSAAQQKFAAQKALLHLPGSIRITAHPFFEEPGLRIDFEAGDVERFRKTVAELQQAAQSEDLKRLFDSF